MRVEKKEEAFRPVTIIIETKEELDALIVVTARDIMIPDFLEQQSGLDTVRKESVTKLLRDIHNCIFNM